MTEAGGKFKLGADAKLDFPANGELGLDCMRTARKLLGKYIFPILGRCQRGNEGAGLFRGRSKGLPRPVNAPMPTRINPAA